MATQHVEGLLFLLLIPWITLIARLVLCTSRREPAAQHCFHWFSPNAFKIRSQSDFGVETTRSNWRNRTAHKLAYTCIAQWTIVDGRPPVHCVCTKSTKRAETDGGPSSTVALTIRLKRSYTHVTDTFFHFVLIQSSNHFGLHNRRPQQIELKTEPENEEK